jgi:hypothetical protein
MKKSFVFAALFALASIGLVFVGCNNGGGSTSSSDDGGGNDSGALIGVWYKDGAKTQVAFTITATTITGNSIKDSYTVISGGTIKCPNLGTIDFAISNNILTLSNGTGLLVSLGQTVYYGANYTNSGSVDVVGTWVSEAILMTDTVVINSDGSWTYNRTSKIPNALTTYLEGTYTYSGSSITFTPTRVKVGVDGSWKTSGAYWTTYANNGEAWTCTVSEKTMASPSEPWDGATFTK